MPESFKIFDASRYFSVEHEIDSGIWEFTIDNTKYHLNKQEVFAVFNLLDDTIIEKPDREY